MTPTQHAALEAMLPSPRFAVWIRDTLLAQEERTGKKAPLSYHETLRTWHFIRANEPPVEVAILNDDDWAALLELIF